MCLRGSILLNFWKFVYILQTFVYNFSKKKKLRPLKHILALPTWDEICIVSVQQPFTFGKFQLEHPVVYMLTFSDNDVNLKISSKNSADFKKSWPLELSQCRKLWIFLLLRFYVKPILMHKNCQIWFHVKFWVTETQCGNYRILLSHTFLTKISWK